MLIRTLFRLTLVICATLPVTLAQTATGVITGSVLDASGAIVAGARITLLNQETNQTREVVSNSAGVYEFRCVPRGRYTV